MRETHMSWVFLTDQYAYKLKKPVRFEFLDFSTVEARQHNCLEEFRLNQRLAKGVYLGVVPITSTGDGLLEINGKGFPVDWLVWMRRLPEDHMLSEEIRRNQVNNEQLEVAANLLTNFYMQSLSFVTTFPQYKNRIIQEILKDRAELSKSQFNLPVQKINESANALLNFIANNTGIFKDRLQKKRVIEAHGDLKPDHICLLSQPVIIDCLEFNRHLKVMDTAEELAYLFLECELAGAPWVGKVFLNNYMRRSYDQIPDNLIVFYKSKRALLRARLVIRHLLDPAYNISKSKWVNKCHQYLDAALKYSKILV